MSPALEYAAPSDAVTVGGVGGPRRILLGALGEAPSMEEEGGDDGAGEATSAMVGTQQTARRAARGFASLKALLSARRRVVVHQSKPRS